MADHAAPAVDAKRLGHACQKDNRARSVSVGDRPRVLVEYSDMAPGHIVKIPRDGALF